MLAIIGEKISKLFGEKDFGSKQPSKFEEVFDKLSDFHRIADFFLMNIMIQNINCFLIWKALALY